MVQLDFELPSALASTLQKHANNKQKHIDDIVDFALLMHLSMDPRSVEIGVSPDPDLPTPPLSKRKAGLQKQISIRTPSLRRPYRNTFCETTLPVRP